MSATTHEAKRGELTQRSQALYAGCGEAITWVADVRAGSTRLDREADSLTDRLRRTRNLAKRLGRAAGRAVSVGFFGLSQAGKSYLISALAAGDTGALETLVDGRRLNFIQHVNPPGRGKEATGLVTRFTRRPSDAPVGYPLELSLFAEVDLAKVLGNTFYNDFDREQVDLDLSPAHLRRHLAALQPKRAAAPTGGVSEDDVVDLLEYFEQRFPKTTEQLKADYWPTAIALAPYLAPAERAALFSVLWGEVPELTETYLALRGGLAAVGHAETVYAPIEVLVRADANGVLTQGDSIMNVDILERLGRDGDDLIEIVPRRDGALLPAVSIARSLLAALTTELRFVLADPARTGLLEQVDLLDFPGYRGRLAVANLAEVRRELKDDQADPVAQLVLRGKVAFLFERYTDDQEMNVLVLCAPSSKQSDVKDLGPVLETWVRATQGADPETRGRRPPGLIFALTMFDQRLNLVPGDTEDLLRKSWEGMMKMALTERFGSYEWLREWSPGAPFDNLFLVRKPGMAKAVIETDDQERERDLLPSARTGLDLLRRTFCEEPSVKRHLADPAGAWDAMLSLNDGGISRLGGYLARVVVPESKLARIDEQLAASVDELLRHRFAAYYRAEGAAEVENKRRLVERVLTDLRRRPDRLAAFLDALQPPREGLRALYLRSEDPALARARSAREGGAEAPAPSAPAAPAAPKPASGLIDLDAMLSARTPSHGAPAAGPGTTESLPRAAKNERAVRFVRAVLSYWVGHMKALPEDPHWLAFIDLERGVVEDLISELITAADRLELDQVLIGLIDSAESQTAAMRSQLAERQVFATATRINRFVDYLGCDLLALDERPRSLIGEGRPVFAPPPPIAPRALPVLPATQINFSALFVLDWFEAFRELAIANAGHASDRDISPEQNARLGQILSRVAGETAARSI
jgi:hypothetical protein